MPSAASTSPSRRRGRALEEALDPAEPDRRLLERLEAELDVASGSARRRCSSAARCRGRARARPGSVSELPSDLLIFSPAVVIQALCIQYDANGCPAARDCACSFSWCGKRRSTPPPWMSKARPRYLPRHRRALDVPAGPAAAPRRSARRRSRARLASSSPSTARSRAGRACRAGRRPRRPPCRRCAAGSARRTPARTARRSRRRRSRPRRRRRGPRAISSPISSSISGTWPVARGLVGRRRDVERGVAPGRARGASRRRGCTRAGPARRT